MEKLLIFSFIFLMLFLSPFVVALSLEEEAGTLPDSAFYGIDKALEDLDIALTFNKDKKVEKYLKHAQERLAEMQVLLKNNKSIEEVIKGYEEKITKVNEVAEIARTLGQNKSNLPLLIETATSKHLEVLDRVKKGIVAPSTQDVIERARIAIIKQKKPDRLVGQRQRY